MMDSTQSNCLSSHMFIFFFLKIAIPFSLDCQLNHTNVQLDKLSRTNVFNATFHIWHKGHFGTINNFRLGRLPSAPVDWSEINAAWGQTALLLNSLARKINLTFDRFKLVPFGNHTHILVSYVSGCYPTVSLNLRETNFISSHA